MLGRLFKDKSAHWSTMQFPLQGWIKKCHPSHWVTDGWLPSTPPPHFENSYGSAVKHWHWQLIPGMVLSPPWLRPRVAPPCSQLANRSLSQTSHNNYSSHFTLLIFSLAIHQESFWRRCMVDWHPSKIWAEVASEKNFSARNWNSGVSPWWCSWACLNNSLCQKQKKFEFCFVRFVALEGWYGDPRKRFSNL